MKETPGVHVCEGIQEFLGYRESLRDVEAALILNPILQRLFDFFHYEGIGVPLFNPDFALDLCKMNRRQRRT